jgi:uncharacterized protein (TIGR00290 family)
LSWSGGKDSALALHELRERGTPPDVLLTTYDEQQRIVPHHGVAIELLQAQADAADLPLVSVPLPSAASNTTYEQRLKAAFASPPLSAVSAVAFGDLFLEDLRQYREARMAEAGLRALFPLWHRNTRTLARSFVADGFRATLVSVDGDQLGRSFVGRAFDEALLDELPSAVDPCGERGEFHTFVHDGPIFAHPLTVEAGLQSTDGRFAWLELRVSQRPRVSPRGRPETTVSPRQSD